MDLASNNWVTSKDILEITGISRATLNNYIKLGILPRPVVARGAGEQSGVKQIGYFPIEMVGRVQQVQELKKSGLSMSDIAVRVGGKPGAPNDRGKEGKVYTPVSERAGKKAKEKRELRGLPWGGVQDGGSKPGGGGEESSPPPAPEPSAKPVREVSAEPTGKSMAMGGVRLTLDSIGYPAYLVNPDCEIEWINRHAEDLVFKKNISSISEVEARNIFKLFFSWELHASQTNWQDILRVHLGILREEVGSIGVESLFQGITSQEIRLLKELDSPESLFAQTVEQNGPLLHFSGEGKGEKTFRVHTLSFREGKFIVLLPVDTANHELLHFLKRRQNIIRELLQNRMPALVSLCVLVANLQNAVQISAELLPEEYFLLVNELWQLVVPCCERHHGIYGRQAGNGMVYYFISKSGTNYIQNSINCALELRENMKKMSGEWKARKGWGHELCLNIGLNEGQEFFGSINSAANIEFTAIGDSTSNTSHLADFGRGGAIWTTKNLISKLSPEERRRIRFGIHRRQNNQDAFIRNSFARVIDLLDSADHRLGKFVDIATLPIAEIVERDTKG